MSDIFALPIETRLVTRVRSGGLFPAALFVAMLVLASSPLLMRTAFAAPPAPGRTWTGVDTLVVNGHEYMIPGRFETTRGGVLRMAGRGMYGPGKHLAGFEWADSTWRVRWVHHSDSFTPFYCPAPSGDEFFVWKSQIAWPWYYTHPYDYLLASRVSGDSLATPDTIAVVTQTSYMHAGAAGLKAQWAAIWDWDWSTLSNGLRLFARDSTTSGWIETRPPLSSQAGSAGLALAELNDSTALVIEADGDLVHWGTLCRGAWTYGGYLSFWGVDQYPSMLRRAENGYWLSWGSGDRTIVLTRLNMAGAIVDRDTVLADYPPTTYQDTKNSALSLDLSERPAVAWSAYGDNGVEYLYVSFPSDTGWATGQQVPGSARGLAPVIARDENGDVWLAWWNYVVGGILWSHTYTQAVCDTPRAGEQHGRPLIQWTLSESAPESWWTVWRSTSGGEFEQAGRIEAGAGTAMSFADSSAQAGATLRYCVRRECKDVRYQWTSAPVEWLGRGTRLGVALRSRNPAATSIDLEVQGANAGPMRADLYDLQGRVVATARGAAAGSGRDALRMELEHATSVRPGLYLLRVRGADGRVSPGVKIAVIR